MDFKEQVEQLLAEALDETPSLFLIDLTIGVDRSIRITLDGDQGVNLASCMKVSRKIEHSLDRDTADFSLEVSSCGVGSPLFLARQFKNNLKRRLEVVDENGKVVQGTLVDATEDAFTIEWKAREPKSIGKGKVTVTKTKFFKYGEFKSAKVLVTI